MIRARKTILTVLGFFLAAILIIILAAKILYTRRTLGELTFEPDYYWADEKCSLDKWDFVKTYAGYDYFLYIPPEFKNDRHNESIKLPMYVLFHGSESKGISLGRYGRMFTDSKIQSLRPCAVLVILARCGYFSDCHDTSMLIQNILLQNECIDKKNIIAFGHSQGAYYAVKLAVFQPELFKAVISGSGYYQLTPWELLKVLPIQFWWGNARNDKGIYEQAWKSGRRVARYCRNSVYAEYEKRGHFWVEANDVDPESGTVFLDWLRQVLEN
ncbi:MAG: prolyl oligopeptidase family serine peptidase [Treponema sp.]|nr:prolyl oligopeptidase family serine peptidase [Treponema sp.]